MSKPLEIMNKTFEINPKTDFVLERFIDAPRHLVWEALTKPEHLKEWYMPKPWGVVSDCELDVRPGGIFQHRHRNARGSGISQSRLFLGSHSDGAAQLDVHVVSRLSSSSL